MRRSKAWSWCLVILIGIFSLLFTTPTPAAAISETPLSTAKGNLRNEVLYYITVDRFYDGDQRNNVPDFAFPTSVNQDRKQQVYNQINRSLIHHAYDPSHRYVGMFWGGDLEGVIQKLDYLQDLGVTQLVLSPIQDGANAILYSPGEGNIIRSQVDPQDEKRDPFYSGVYTSFHGTWTKDWFEIDEHLRDPDTEANDHLQVFRRLLDEAGERGIGVILELGLNSTSPYRGSLEYGEFNLGQGEQWIIDNGSVYRQGELVAPYLDPGSSTRDPKGWFHPSLGINYKHPTQEMLEKGSVGGLPDLAQERDEVRDYFLDAIRFWLTFNQGGHQISGFYLETIANIPRQFWRDLEEVVFSINPDAILIGEYSGAGYTHRQAVDWYAQTKDYTWMDYGYSMAARNYFRRVRNWDGRTYVLREHALGHQGQYYNYSVPEQLLHQVLNPSESLEIPRRSLDLIPDQDAKGWVNFIESHDQPRLFSNDPNMTKQAYASLIEFMFISPGVPMLMYGVETGLAVPYHIDQQGLFGVGGSPFNLPMMIWPEDSGWDPDLFEITRRLAHFRQKTPVLRYGATHFLYPEGSRKDNDLFMVREDPDCDSSEAPCDQVLFAYSTLGGAFQIPLNLSAIDQVIQVETDQVKGIDSGKFSIQLQPEQAQVFWIQSALQTETSLAYGH